MADFPLKYGRTNYNRYTATLNTIINSAPILTHTITIMPTDRLVYLPVVEK